MDARHAIEYIENTGWSKTRLGLSRCRKLLSSMGEPQRQLRFIHVAGSNGKGSTCAMLDSILREAGYRTGLFTSPYIEQFSERIRVNGESIPLEALAEITSRLAEIADAMDDHPSQFELITALAMEYFRLSHCDIVILEVGMGGEFDATNVIDAPELAVICNIGLEHTEYLGSTLEEIAHTKAGIIKPGCRCVRYDGESQVNSLIDRLCMERGVPVHASDFKALHSLSLSLQGQSFRYRGESYSISLLGEHQLKNAAVAIEAVQALRLCKYRISDEHLRQGLIKARWMARLELLGASPRFLLDGGHNPQCAEALASSIDALFPGEKATLLLGILSDKDYVSVLKTVLPYASSAICLTPSNPRALKAEALAEQIRSMGVAAEAYESVGEGIEAALTLSGRDGLIVAFGSLYLAGEVRKGYIPALKSHIRKSCLAARKAIDSDKRRELSASICRHIADSEAFARARVVMLYKPLPSEVDLDSLPSLYRDKLYVYPLCTQEGAMLALSPVLGFQKGAHGILEPVYDERHVISPEAIDLIICPCAGFDRSMHRLGMGRGYYDRFLPQCSNAVKIAAAYSVQECDPLPVLEHDIGMDAVATECGIRSLECGIRS